MESRIAKKRNEQWPQTTVRFRAVEPDTSEAGADYADVLAELHVLLEDYAPPWYTERLHERTEQVLRMLGSL